MVDMRYMQNVLTNVSLVISRPLYIRTRICIKIRAIIRVRIRIRARIRATVRVRRPGLGSEHRFYQR